MVLSSRAIRHRILIVVLVTTGSSRASTATTGLEMSTPLVPPPSTVVLVEVLPTVVIVMVILHLHLGLPFAFHELGLLLLKYLLLFLEGLAQWGKMALFVVLHHTVSDCTSGIFL